jgi:hypothetical protein
MSYLKLAALMALCGGPVLIFFGFKERRQIPEIESGGGRQEQEAIAAASRQDTVLFPLGIGVFLLGGVGTGFVFRRSCQD